MVGGAGHVPARRADLGAEEEADGAAIGQDAGRAHLEEILRVIYTCFERCVSNLCEQSGRFGS